MGPPRPASLAGAAAWARGQSRTQAHLPVPLEPRAPAHQPSPPAPPRPPPGAEGSVGWPPRPAPTLAPPPAAPHH
eukprot:10664896-Prorocentrum_lima.AAC.1